MYHTEVTKARRAPETVQDASRLRVEPPERAQGSGRHQGLYHSAFSHYTSVAERPTGTNEPEFSDRTPTATPGKARGGQQGQGGQGTLFVNI